MEINGRECEEIKIDGISYFYISKFVAGDFLRVLDSKYIERLNVTEGRIKEIEMSLIDLYNDMIPLTTYFCLLGKNGEKEITITEEYLKGLESIEHFNKLIETTVGVVSKVAGGEKKALRQSEE